MLHHNKHKKWIFLIKTNPTNLHNKTNSFLCMHFLHKCTIDFVSSFWLQGNKNSLKFEPNRHKR